MKKLILFTIIAYLFSCAADDNILDNYWGTVSAEINGEQWTARIVATNNVLSHDLFNIGCDVFNDELLRREFLLIRSIPRSLGVYQVANRDINELESTYSYYETLALDGDVGCDYYDLNDEFAETNIVNVTRFDDNGSLIEGTFHLTFLIEDAINKCNPNAPDTIKFRNGRFQTRITR